MNFTDIEDIYRSRLTLLDILEERGYDTEPFRKLSPDEIAAAVPDINGLFSLSFTAKKKDAADSKICLVRYGKFSRQKLGTFFNDYPDETIAETIVMMMDPVTDPHHQVALRLYLTKPNPIRVSFFSIYQLVNNPMKHKFVPKHEIVPLAEEEAIMAKYHMIAKSKFPIIRFHIDPIVRLLGAAPGNLIKITRPSLSAGVYEFYRVVSP